MHQNHPPRIIFMGTPDFALATLEALLQHGYSVVAVVTAPDKPAGRGLKLSESAVKQFAVAKGIPVLQPAKLKDPEFIAQLKSFKADVQIVVAFRMLPELVWSMPPLGTINLHGSLLPQYRGAAPINRAIMNGETETGVTTFKLQQEIDTGNILLMEKLPIGPDETAGELHDRMKIAGAGLVVRTLQGLGDGTLKEQPQSIPEGAILKMAPKIFAADCEINWSLPVAVIHNHIRGLSPYPGAFTRFHEKMLKIFRSRPEIIPHDQTPGSSGTDGRSWLRFAAADGFIYAEEMQLEGKKRLPVADFLRGHRP
ncbi:MAG: methionyl-tRNA formyltransferase [Bacteroidota bacterium]|nr:methionyl-tRNA formyltransferase [Bacteroidota bacterium]MDP4250640.1 methionyl-tRNA formyltransferase [Bacteroidota bacterium]